MTTNPGTIAMEVENGTFDICQQMVKSLLRDKAFAFNTSGDPDFFGTANSINIARLLPQAVYPFWAHSRLEEEAVMIPVIPSGNLGDVTGTQIARMMGLPVSVIVAAQNDNRVFHDFLMTGEYKAIQPFNTESLSMDIGAPNNLPRIIHLYGGQMANGIINSMPFMSIMNRDFNSSVLDNAGHKIIIREVYNDARHIIDPHTATAWSAWDELEDDLWDQGKPVLYETAAPEKFPAIIKEATGVTMPIPDIIRRQAALPETIFRITAMPDEVDGVKVMSQEQYRQVKVVIESEIKKHL